MLFRLGKLLATRGALQALQEARQDYQEFLRRHATGDWGEICGEDQERNNQALKDGTRLLSAYTTKKGEKLWIITEADRSATTLLLPDEY